ncbi:MAG: hypothetical protein JO235_25225 [Chroococcidiopsidaceae cyanobacterium CP_BM_RX_35]|nr:hypothetical protein [Chroococcidiopsidaceae cyanobacterium CP_BM_RX_35]
MARKRIDWETLEPTLRKRKKEELLKVLRDAYQTLSASDVVSVFGAYVDFTTLDLQSPRSQGMAPNRLLAAVQNFHNQSLAGQYYESFQVNSQNFMEKSEGTELWISECNQLFDKCVELSAQGHHAEVHAAMDLLFELLAQLDIGNDEIIFFADEAGSWQVGINDEKVLPTYFTTLAAVAKPEDYALRVMEIIKQHGSYASEKFSEVARKVANEAQREALAKKRGPI